MKSNGLHKSEILRGKRRFNELFRKGNSRSGKYINVIYNEAEDFKIGFAVSQKIRGKVNKNKIKRQLKEIFRTNPFRPTAAAALPGSHP